MSSYRVIRSIEGQPERDHRFMSARSHRAAALSEREPGEVLAESYLWDDGKTEVFEVFSSRAELTAHPDGDPFADTIRVCAADPDVVLS